MIELIVSGFILGLMGSGHCIAMCGGIISSLSMATTNQPIKDFTSETVIKVKAVDSINDNHPTNKWLLITLYQVGRVLSYSFAGLVVGVIGSYFGNSVESLTSIPLLKIFSALLLILMGLSIARLQIEALNIEKLGRFLWDKIKPLSRYFLPANTPNKALLLGSVWGWLPCGLVYTSLGYAVATADPVSSMLFMLSFGLGTLPSSILVSGMSVKLKQLLNNIIVLRITGLIFVLFGIYMIIAIFGNQSGHMHH